MNKNTSCLAEKSSFYKRLVDRDEIDELFDNLRKESVRELIRIKATQEEDARNNPKG